MTGQGHDIARPWPGQPDTCTCTRMVAAAIEETLGCADGWRWVPRTGWVHRWPLQRRPRETAQAAT